MSRIEEAVREALADCGGAQRGLSAQYLADTAITAAKRARRQRRFVAGSALTVMLVAAAVTTSALLREPPAITPASGSVSDLVIALPTGPPPLLDTFSRRAIRTMDGIAVDLEVPGGSRVTEVTRMTDSWVVLAGAVFIRRDDGSRIDLVSRVGGTARRVSVRTGTDRVAVQVITGEENTISVYAAPSGALVGRTQRPPAPDGPYLAGVLGDRVVLVAATGPRVGPPPASDLWDPTAGPYQGPLGTSILSPDHGTNQSPDGTWSTSRRWLIPERGVLVGVPLALEPGDDPDVPCLVRLDPKAGYAVSTRTCDTAFTWDDSVWVSPDGRYLLVYDFDRDGPRVLTVEPSFGATTVAGPLLPAGLDIARVWWESTTTVLVEPVQAGGGPSRDGGVRNLLRCRLDAPPCERVPLQPVDDAAPLGLVSRAAAT